MQMHIAANTTTMMLFIQFIKNYFTET